MIDHLSELKQHAADVGDGASMPMDVNELQINMDPLYGEGWHVLRVTFGCNVTLTHSADFVMTTLL